MVVEPVLDLVDHRDAHRPHEARLPEVRMARRSASSLARSSSGVRLARSRSREQRARSRAGGRGCSSAAPPSDARSAPVRRRACRGSRARPASRPASPAAAPSVRSRLPGCGDAPAMLRRALEAVLVQVLGDVRKLGKERRRVHRNQAARRSRSGEHGLELGARLALLLAPEAQRGPSDALDQRERLLARLLADRVAEQHAEEADVVMQARAVGRRYGHAANAKREACRTSRREGTTMGVIGGVHDADRLLPENHRALRFFL